MADVDVTFGARIDQLTTGVASVKSQLEGLNSGVSNLMGSFGQLGGVAKMVTGTLAAFGLEELARKMADSGVAMERTKTALGVSSEQMLTLKSAAELAGVDIDTLAMSIERMSLIIQRSTRDALGPQSQALRVLGLNAKDLIGMSADQYFLKIADAASKFNPSLNLTNALMTIGGRSMTQMVGAFRQGSDEIKKFTEEMKQTKTGTEGFGQASEMTHRNLALMDSATSALGKQLFTELSPAINVIIVNSRDFANEIRNSVKEGGAWAYALNAVSGALKSIVTAMSGITALFRFMSAEAKALWRAFSEDGEEAAKKIASDLKKDLEGITKDLAATFKALWGPERITVGPKDGMLDAAQINEQARKELEIKMKALDSQTALVEENFNRQQTLYERDVINLNITEDQKTKLVSAASGQRYAAELVLLQRKLLLGDLDIAQRADIENKITELVQKRITDTLKRENDYIKDVASQWNSVLGTVQQAWDSQLQGLLTGTTSWAQAMRNIFLNLTTAIISEFEKVAIKIASIKLQEAFPSFSPAGIIPGLLGGGGGAQAAATTANTTALTALNAQLSALLTALGINVAATEESVIATSAQTTATFSNTLATFANTIATEWDATVTAIGDFLPFAAGAWNTSHPNIPFPSYASGSFSTKGGLAMIHPDEMIIPAGPAQAIRDGASLGGGAGHTVNIHISAMDAGGFHGALKGGLGDAITRHVSRALQSNPSMRPGYTT